MGFTSTLPNDAERIDDMGSMNPIDHLEADGAFTGTWQALYKGVASGVASVGRTADAASQLQFPGNPLAPVGGALSAFDAHEPLDESLAKVQDWAKTDPRVQGVGAQMLGTTARGLTVTGLGSLMGGPVIGAGTLASSEGLNDYRESIAAGIDPTTAAEKAGLTAATAGLGAFLPMKFGTGGALGFLQSAVGGAAINTGFGIASRAATSTLLEHAGYSDMAKQYRDLDANAVAADIVLGLAFGGIAHMTHGSEVPAAERPDSNTVQVALDARRNEMIERGGAGIPVDPARANLDARLQDAALGDVLRGHAVEVAHDDAQSMIEGALADPEKISLNEAYNRAGIAAHGDIADFSEPPRLAETIAPFEPMTDEAAKSSKALDALSPFASEQLRQLSERFPDLEVQMADGRTVNAGDMRTEIARDMATADREADLHLVAAACFLRQA